MTVQNQTTEKVAKKRPYRKNNNQSKPNNHTKKAFNPYPKKNNDESFENHTEIAQPLHTFELYKPFTDENNIYTYLKQSSGFNPSKFWELLNIALKTKKFEDIKTERLSLISYVVIYDKENIYSELLNKYFDSITQEEIEKSLFPLSLSKNPIFTQATLDKYKEKYNPSNEFLHDFINSMTKFSYRKDNNVIILNWLNEILNKTEITFFWKECIKENNIPLFELALNFKNFNQVLRDNYDNYFEDIKNISKNHTTEKSFISPIINEKEIQDILNKYKDVQLFNKIDTYQVNIEEEKNNDEPKQTIVITKKTKKMI